MKTAVLILLIALPLGLQAQTSEPTPDGTTPTSETFPVEKVQLPTNADLNCAGFLSKEVGSREKYVAGGLESPFTTQFANDEAIFLNGHGYELGKEYEIVRELKDPNRYELFPGQWSALKASGHPYEELGRVVIVDTRHKMAIAKVEFSCNTILPGDFAIPYVEKPTFAFHAPMRFDRFIAANGASGRILLAKDFDSELGNGVKVYMNIGSSQGLKVGDYLRATRTYEATAHDSVDSLSFAVTAMEPTQARQPRLDGGWMNQTNGPNIHIADMPRRGVGEIVIISTTPSTSTGMIVFSLEPVHVGDRVEVDQQ